MIIPEEEYLAHYGILRKSGRYPWGSGETQSERNRSFLSSVDALRKDGMSEADIAKGFKMTTTELRAARSIAKNEEKQADILMAQRLKDKGYSNSAIGRRMGGLNESSVRSLLAPGAKDRADVLEATSNMLKDQVSKKGFIDVGSGVEHHIGVSQTKLGVAVARLREEGYVTHTVQVDQLGTGQKTLVKVLAPPGTTYADIAANKDKIQQIAEHSNDGGRSFLGLRPPTSIDSRRIAIRYADQGGAESDGVIFVRRGKEDLSLGGKNYAQVRIAVDGTHYIKGMAIYKDDMPAGVDLVVNVNKKNTGNKLDALKPMKRDKDGNIDMDNPFGASIKPGGQRGVHNIVNEEGDWDKWSRTLSSQMLSKQKPSLAKEQLGVTQERKRKELDEILALTNPTVRKKLLESFADDADAASVHLKAAALPRTANHVILPMNSLKDNEIYAPNYENGERVALVRHPHGGIFEIPELTVNNKNPEARAAIGTSPRDAVGINHRVAQRLSGADFDGDTVLVIPNNQGKVKSSPALKGLEKFDPIASYPGYDGMPKMTARTKAVQMGDITNLIADMTIKGANTDELARAVRHSMVVIDAEKHNLDYKSSALANGIPQLKQKYQGSARAGASTLITRASSEKRVAERKPRSAAQGGSVDPTTGKRVFVDTGASFVNKSGKVVLKTTKSKKLAETNDASTLSSGTVIEKVYADHSNALKAMANEARKAAVSTKNTPYSSSAKTAYSREVADLNSKLNVALRNAPLERQAQLLANAVVSHKRQAHPDMEPSELKRLKAQALQEARARTGAGKKRIEITDKEWAAIQAGAISTNKLKQILDNADLDRVKALATPRESSVMTSAKKQRALAMRASGYTQAEIANAIGVSLTTLKTELD